MTSSYAKFLKRGWPTWPNDHVLDPYFFKFNSQLCEKKDLTIFHCWDKILLNSSWKMLLSSPKARFITFFKARLTQSYPNSKLMTDATYIFYDKFWDVTEIKAPVFETMPYPILVLLASLTRRFYILSTMSVCPSFSSLTVYLSVPASVCVCVCISVLLFIHPSVRPSVNLSVCLLFVYVSFCLPACLSFHSPLKLKNESRTTTFQV